MKNIDEIIKYTQKLRLLYVEDHQSTREASLYLLENFFGDITIAVDGRDGIQKFKDNDIDLIITDINMPYINGLEMIQEIKKIDKDIKVIVFSANMDAKYFTESIQLGVNGYLIKPIEIEHLINILSNIVSSIRLSDEIARGREIEKRNHKYLQTVVDASHDPIMVINRDYKIEFMSKSIRDKLENKYVSDSNNIKCYEILHKRSTPCNGDDNPCPLKSIMENKKATTMIHKYRDEGEDDTYMEIGATPLLDDNGKCIGIVETFRDITSHVNAKDELIKQKKVLEYKAYHDELTGLANKSLFEDRLRQAIARTKRGGKKFALFFIDLNKFKWVNDNLGHDTGDVVLKRVSQLVSKDMREEDTFARLGGDEFVVIMENINHKDESQMLAQKILKRVEEPIYHKENKINISASIGVSIYPDDSDDINKLIKYADLAMYSAKEGNDNICYYHNRLS